jgi:phasin family protein
MADNPYGNMDFMKMMADYKLPGFDMESMMAMQKRNMEALTQANQLALEAMQAVLTRQTEVLRQTLEESAAAMRGLMDPSSGDDKVTRQADLMKTSFEKALANMREVAELMTKSQREASEVINRRIAESLDEVRTSLTKK